MNDTNVPTEASMRYDSADDNADRASGGDRHTIQTYLSDALALEQHIAEPLKRQLEMNDSARFPEATDIISSIASLTNAHIVKLQALLEASGAEAVSPVKSAWAKLLGAGAAIVDGSRKTKVSKSLRDDYTALALATASYTMLNATALGLGDAAAAQLAKEHLEDYAPVVSRIGRSLSAVVLEELALDGENVQVSVAQFAEQTASNAWK